MRKKGASTQSTQTRFVWLVNTLFFEILTHITWIIYRWPCIFPLDAVAVCDLFLNCIVDMGVKDSKSPNLYYSKYTCMQQVFICIIVARLTKTSPLRKLDEVNKILAPGYDNQSDNAAGLTASMRCASEWDKHGKCAGMQDVNDFLEDACSLAAEPLALMAKARDSGVDNTYDIAESLYQAGYPVWKATYYDVQEIQLSACAGADLVWKLADPDEFAYKCGGSSPPASRPSAPRPAGPAPRPASSSAGQCVPGARGPACSSNADCAGVSGCKRCAKSGYCTNIP